MAADIHSFFEMKLDQLRKIIIFLSDNTLKVSFLVTKQTSKDQYMNVS